ncbi:MAG TPA: putative molybdenum carrier protein [Aeromicrobium sp.]|nr:putative molybdenum carrier protein [Aeromicrobium sp.]
MSEGAESPPVARIVSGGQTGADRAALDVAIELGIDYGGWCPAGGWAEDYPEPPGLLAAYPRLRPTWEADATVRTRLNVRDSDATLVVYDAGTTSPGTQSTIDAARAEGRPFLVTPGDVAETAEWLAGLPKRITLNVAGPRESSSPGTYQRTADLLRAVLA